MSGRLAVAVDGGNSKTDLALFREGGALLAFVHGPLSSPFHLGELGAADLLGGLLAEARAKAELPDTEPIGHAQVMLAGIDFPDEEDALRDRLDPRSWGESVVVDNDTFALLRAEGIRVGGARSAGVGIVCGAGINCVGIGTDGRRVRFPSLGSISGDWGGGYDIGLAALGAAVRGSDGRGPPTVLQRVVPAHFGLASPEAVVVALHRRELLHQRLVELAPAVLAAAGSDGAAAAIVERLASEVVAFARATFQRLGRGGHGLDVIFGGGVARARDPRLIEQIERGLPGRRLVISQERPIVGSALLALDALGGDQAAADTLVRALRGAGRASGARPVLPR